MSLYRKVYNKLKRILFAPEKRFDSTGERVDITYTNRIHFDSLDMYQKSHIRRYEFAINIVKSGENCGDFACGTGYGSVMLASKVGKVTGVDLNGEVISAITKRYEKIKNVSFIEGNLLNLNYDSSFDTIISFETIEHFTEDNISDLLNTFNKALKPKGKLVFSTPYMQERNEAAIKLGHHLTFYINEGKLEQWLTKAGFSVHLYKYQNYETHNVENSLDKKDFIICVAHKF